MIHQQALTKITPVLFFGALLSAAITSFAMESPPPSPRRGGPLAAELSPQELPKAYPYTTLATSSRETVRPTEKLASLQDLCLTTLAHLVCNPNPKSFCASQILDLQKYAETIQDSTNVPEARLLGTLNQKIENLSCDDLAYLITIALGDALTRKITDHIKHNLQGYRIDKPNHEEIPWNNQENQDNIKPYLDCQFKLDHEKQILVNHVTKREFTLDFKDEQTGITKKIHIEPISNVQLNDRGNLLILWSNDATSLWSVHKENLTLLLRIPRYVDCACISARNKYLLTQEGNKATLWNLGNTPPNPCYTMSNDRHILKINISPSEEHVTLESYEELQLYYLDSQNSRWITKLKSPGSDIESFFSPKGNYLAVVLNKKNYISVGKLKKQSMKEVINFEISPSPYQSVAPFTITFCQDEDHVRFCKHLEEPIIWRLKPTLAQVILVKHLSAQLKKNSDPIKLTKALTMIYETLDFRVKERFKGKVIVDPAHATPKPPLSAEVQITPR